MSVVDVKVDNNAIQKLAEKLNSEDLSVRFRTMKKLRQLIQSSAVVTDGLLGFRHFIDKHENLLFRFQPSSN